MKNTLKLIAAVAFMFTFSMNAQEQNPKQGVQVEQDGTKQEKEKSCCKSKDKKSCSKDGDKKSCSKDGKNKKSCCKNKKK